MRGYPESSELAWQMRYRGVSVGGSVVCKEFNGGESKIRAPMHVQSPLHTMSWSAHSPVCLKRFAEILNGLCSTMLTETLNASDQVHGDAPLSATSEKQICFKLKTKATDFLSVLPDVVYCSPLRRALRTALVAYPSDRIKVDPRLREIDANAGMMKTELENFVAATCPNRKAKALVCPLRSPGGTPRCRKIRRRLRGVFSAC